ncbi:hypothetical protein FD31_GL002239 [Companilactobacillus nantensis DSM 16982]|uniref:Uncharacterized protein n=2 Tax=Companilactobacillus nantensis TaxID=305793 RepID=A0A0R1W8Y2_9LACO|nr:hypothetical protein FD31_GL002239 [Companilactobacillus nantensis DSM 16982]
MYFWYEIIVLGVIYEALIVFRVMTKNINGMLVLVLLLAVFVGQWWYFYHKNSSRG